MLSMTGFAEGEAPLGDGRLTLEIRALNHRFLDVRVRLPAELSEQAFFLEQLARELLTRGRYDIGVRLDGQALAPPHIALDRARAAYAALGRLRDEVAPGSELPLTAVATLPDIITFGSSADTDALRGALRVALSDALRRLDEMRRTEGAALRRELHDRLQSARRCRDRIAARSGEVVLLHRARLEERLARLLEDVGVPLEKGRLETELALIADRSDITEELVRLASHFDQFEQLLSLRDEPVGRRLDFLLQEVGREANTTGSKSQDAPLSHLVVELKAEIERLREQVQNVQ
jgi:uncharacterized protein (TIGR00255 family)